MTAIPMFIDSTNLQTILLFSSVICIGLWVFFPRRGKLPPGPTPWPLLGNAPLFARSKLRYEALVQMSREYGDISSLMIMHVPLIIISSFTAMKEVLVEAGDATLARPDFYLIRRMTGGKGLIFQQNLNHWKELRRLCSSSLREFGVGKKSLEKRIQEEIVAVLGEFDKLKGSPFDIRTIVPKAVSNIILSIVFGNRYEYKDKEFCMVQDDFDFFVRHQGQQLFGEICPGFEKLPYIGRNIRRLLQVKERLRGFMCKKIREHEESFDANDIKDFTDLYLDISKEGKAQDTAFSDENIFQLILDLLLTGTETVGTTLQWAVLFMVLHPDVQEKCRQEIIREVGSSNLPCLSDRSKCIYTEATILEIQRLGIPVPILPPHAASKTFRVRDYVIPKGAVIMADIYSIQTDPDVYSDPEEFKPERWLQKDGTLWNRDQFVPYGIGPRVCPGAALAKMELFLFFSGLIQQYEFKMADPENPPSGKGMPGLTRGAEPFNIIVNKV